MCLWYKADAEFAFPAFYPRMPFLKKAKRVGKEVNFSYICSIL